MPRPRRRAQPGPPFETIRVSTWDEFRNSVEGVRFRSWAFRGQADARWPLVSALSRHLQYAGLHRLAWEGQEGRILRIFKRKSHLFLTHIPDERDSFEWLALMQHHGAPTRLLDVTWSPYVAAFFALERGADTAAVWAFNAGALSHGTHRLKDGRRLDLREVGTWRPGSYEAHFLQGDLPFVIIGEPRIMNRRLIAQSGTFLIPSMPDQSVDAILSNYQGSETLLVKLELDARALRADAMRALYSMNITNATLFPDLDGLARSMAYELEYHWAFNPIDLTPNPGFPDPRTTLALERGGEAAQRYPMRTRRRVTR